tara:strand:+ start:102 stop:260 length:159 start_codon:yes stop_codon:yes gene_type:complete
LEERLKYKLTLKGSSETKNIVNADTRSMAIDYFAEVMKLDRSVLLKIYFISP